MLWAVFALAVGPWSGDKRRHPLRAWGCAREEQQHSHGTHPALRWREMKHFLHEFWILFSYPFLFCAFFCVPPATLLEIGGRGCPCTSYTPAECPQVWRHHWVERSGQSLLAGREAPVWTGPFSLLILSFIQRRERGHMFSWTCKGKKEPALCTLSGFSFGNWESVIFPGHICCHGTEFANFRIFTWKGMRTFSSSTHNGN